MVVRLRLVTLAGDWQPWVVGRVSAVVEKPQPVVGMLRLVEGIPRLVVAREPPGAGRQLPVAERWLLVVGNQLWAAVDLQPAFGFIQVKNAMIWVYQVVWVMMMSCSLMVECEGLRQHE